jgi:hypothetical protein
MTDVGVLWWRNKPPPPRVVDKERDVTVRQVITDLNQAVADLRATVDPVLYERAPREGQQ